MNEGLKGHFLNLYYMALSDLQIDTIELEMLYKIGEERGVLVHEIDEVVIHPDKFKFQVPETVLEKIESLYDLARIAWADGIIDKNEVRVMEMFCEKFGFEALNVPIISQFLFDEVKKGSSKEEISKIVTENI